MSRNENFLEKFFFRSQERRKGAMEKGTEDTSKVVQIEEVKCAIEKLSFVTVLSPVRAVKGKGRGYGVTLRCPSCEEYGSCGKKQEPPVHVSSVHPMEEACLQELLKRLQDRHVDCAAKWLSKKLILMPPQLLQWIQMHQMCCRR
jgi:predicted metal-binding protein